MSFKTFIVTAEGKVADDLKIALKASKDFFVHDIEPLGLSFLNLFKTTEFKTLAGDLLGVLPSLLTGNIGGAAATVGGEILAQTQANAVAALKTEAATVADQVKAAVQPTIDAAEAVATSVANAPVQPAASYPDAQGKNSPIPVTTPPVASMGLNSASQPVATPTPQANPVDANAFDETATN